MSKEEIKIENKYAIKILAQVQSMFNEDSENYVDPSELSQDSDKATAFLHALANIVPAHVYRSLTGDEQDNLGFNHIANRLCFQFGSKIETESTNK